MESICRKIAYYCYEKGYIELEDVNALRFSFELYITQLITFLSMFFIGILLNRFIETIVYSIFFCTLRKKVNGFHAKTFLGCYTLSIINFVVILLMCDYQIHYYLLNILFIIYIFYYFKNYQDKIMYLIILGYISSLIILYIYQNTYYMNLLSLIFYDVMLMNTLGGDEDEDSNH